VDESRIWSCFAPMRREMIYKNGIMYRHCLNCPAVLVAKGDVCKICGWRNDYESQRELQRNGVDGH
jgi:hypothetical protein